MTEVNSVRVIGSPKPSILRICVRRSCSRRRQVVRHILRHSGQITIGVCLHDEAQSGFCIDWLLGRCKGARQDAHEGTDKEAVPQRGAAGSTFNGLKVHRGIGKYMDESLVILRGGNSARLPGASSWCQWIFA